MIQWIDQPPAIESRNMPTIRIFCSSGMALKDPVVDDFMTT